jgi:hypothetical protein
MLALPLDFADFPAMAAGLEFLPCGFDVAVLLILFGLPDDFVTEILPVVFFSGVFAGGVLAFFGALFGGADFA